MKKLAKKRQARKVIKPKNKVYFEKPKNNYPTLYLCADISINHCGLVLLDDSKCKVAAITDLSKPSLKYPEEIFKSDFNDLKNSQFGFRLFRSLMLRDYHYLNMFDYLFSDYNLYNLYNIELYMEGYAYGAKGTIFEIAEITQTFKMFAYDYFFRNRVQNFELYTLPPMTLKKFITGDGHATKNDIKNELYKKYSINFTDYDCELKGSDISEDLNDAFALVKFGSEFNKWQLGEKTEHNYSDYFNSLKEETILGFRR